MSATERVGGGLVDISAVVTIIGAPIAEALIHGLKGSAGMCWAPMSCFGAIHVAKACLTASVPDWLRESMGLKNPFVDSAIGVMLEVDARKQAKNRVDLGDACAVQVAVGRGGGYVDAVDAVRGASGGARTMGAQSPRNRWRRARHEHARTPSSQIERGLYSEYFQQPSLSTSKAMCIYTLDRNSQLALDTVEPTDRGQPIQIARFMPDVDGILPAWKDWVVLLLSLTKLLESFSLHYLGSHTLWYWTIVGWAHAFISACILQLFNLGRDNPLRAASDIAAGVLPTPLHLGGSGKIVLGMSANVRRHTLWRTLLAFGTIFNVAGLFGTFIYLSKEPNAVILLWVGFQALWLASRSLVYYFVEGAAAARQGLIVSKSWEDSPDDDRRRVLTLLSQLSRHQVSIHPRGVQAYYHDCLSFQGLWAAFSSANWTLTPTLPTSALDPKTHNLDIKLAAGDPLIRSAVWFTGACVNNSDLYDTCVAFISTPSFDGKENRKSGATIAIPCVRVYACDCLREGQRQRGNSHADCGKLEWLYFIPTSTSPTSQTSPSGNPSLPTFPSTHSAQPSNGGAGESWTYIHTPTTGTVSTESLTAVELHGRLERGRWKISLTGIQELKGALEVSREAGSLVMAMLTAMEVEGGMRSNTAGIAVGQDKLGKVESEETEVEIAAEETNGKEGLLVGVEEVQ
jgi:hypothetical protein